MGNLSDSQGDTIPTFSIMANNGSIIDQTELAKFYNLLLVKNNQPGLSLSWDELIAQFVSAAQ